MKAQSVDSFPTQSNFQKVADLFQSAMDTFVAQADRAFVEEDYAEAIQLYGKVRRLPAATSRVVNAIA